MQKYFFVGDKVLYTNLKFYPEPIEGTVIKANPESFEVKWNDGCISTESQSRHMNITKVEK